MIDPERIQRLAAKLVNRKDALEMVHQMRCGGKKFDEGGDKSDSGYMYNPKSVELPNELFSGYPLSLPKYKVLSDGSIVIPGLTNIDKEVRNGYPDVYDKHYMNSPEFTYLRRSDTGEYFRYNKSKNPNLNLSGYEEVPLSELQKSIPRRDYIGGDGYRLNVVRRVPGLLDAIRNKAESYGIDPNLLLHRFMKEGIVDLWTKTYNGHIPASEQKTYFDNLMNQPVGGFGELGLDDVGSNLLEGRYTLKDPSATWSEYDAVNEQGRNVKSVQTPDMNSALEIKAAEMAYRQKELAKRGLTGNAYVNAAYNMGLYNDKLNDPGYVAKNYTVPNYHIFDGGGKFYRTDNERVKRISDKVANNNSAVDLVRKYIEMMGSIPVIDVSPVANIAVSPERSVEVTEPMVSAPEQTGLAGYVPGDEEYVPFVPAFVPEGTDLFSDEAKARRRLKQMYAESGFRKNAVSKSGARGLFQIMPITEKDYITRGNGKSGDVFDPEYNERIRDYVFSAIPKDLGKYWSDDDSDENKLAKLYAAYNWGIGNLRSYLRKKSESGVDISDPENWVGGLNPETRNYVTFLAMDKDVDGTAMTNSAFENAAKKRGYMAEGGKIHIKPENRGKFTALKKRTGHSASWFKAHGTPAQKKMAVFALNAKKWKHGDGGSLDKYGDDAVRKALVELNANKFRDGGEEEGKKSFWKLPVRVPNMTGTATAAAMGLRDIPLADSTVGKEAAVATTALLSPISSRLVPHIFKVLADPLKATTAAGRVGATFADAYGVTSGLSSLSNDVSRAVSGEYGPNDIPGTIMNGMVMFPGTSIINDMRTVDNLSDFGRTLLQVPNITSRSTILNRIAHPVETYRFAGISRNAKGVLPDDLYDRALIDLSEAPFHNRPSGDTDYSIINKAPADNRMAYQSQYDYAGNKVRDRGEFVGLGDRTSKSDFSRGHEFGHLVEDSAWNLGYVTDNFPPPGYVYANDPRPEVQKGEYFADVVGNALTKDAFTETDKEFVNARYPFIQNQSPKFITDPNAKRKPSISFNGVSPEMKKGYNIEMRNLKTAIADGDKKAEQIYRARVNAQIDRLRKLGVDVPDLDI